ncbi:AbfB domain-containing protein [Deinococcus sp.]|uniref:AbfB domain-containing protein n=1 Tax=Deinococcus sp. TaxID=47478 RepID=UPI003B5C3439
MTIQTVVAARSARIAALGLLTLGMVACGQSSVPVHNQASQAHLSAQAQCGNWDAGTVFNPGNAVSGKNGFYYANFKTQGQNPDLFNGPAGSDQPWVPALNCGVPSVPPSVPTSSYNGTIKVGQGYSLRVATPGYTNRSLRHFASQGFTEIVSASSGATLRADASFKAVAGLADANCFSFQSVNFPTKYLRHAFSRLRIDEGSGDLFKADATFCAKAALDGSTYVALESKNYPGRYIRHRNGEVWLDTFEDTKTFRQDATWVLGDAWSK